MYWRISSFPELDHLADADRRAVLRRCAGQGLVIGLIIRSVVGGMLVTILGIGIAEVTLSWRLPWQLAVYLLPFSLAMACVLVYQYHLIRIRGALITYLEQAGRQERLPMCLKCGYNLEGSTGSRCPECGYRIAPRPKAETASEL